MKKPKQAPKTKLSGVRITYTVTLHTPDDEASLVEWFHQDIWSRCITLACALTVDKVGEKRGDRFMQIERSGHHVVKLVRLPVKAKARGGR